MTCPRVTRQTVAETELSQFYNNPAYPAVLLLKLDLGWLAPLKKDPPFSNLSGDSMVEQVMKWHEDGHSFRVVVDKSTLQIVDFHCPHRAEESPACRMNDECVVERFVMEYGFDCNVGVAPVDGTMEIAWTLVGDAKDYATCQVWIIPTTDEFFAAWANSQKAELQSEG